MGGKTGINCFVLITGYFMCKSQISLKKFLKILLEVEFYTICIYRIFVLSGYASFSIKDFAKACVPLHGIGSGFTHSYLVFYLFIPFINILINNISKNMFQKLLYLSIIIFSVMPNMMLGGMTMNYIVWFVIIYLCGAYLRLYLDDKISQKVWGIGMLLSLLASWTSVILGAILSQKINKDITYFFVADSNKILAIITAITSFMFFKSLDIKHNKYINIIAASTFGVFQIHANSNLMRTWLWHDVCKNNEVYSTGMIYIHSIVVVLLIYIVCTIIDIIRIRMVEKPVFMLYDKIVHK